MAYQNTIDLVFAFSYISESFIFCKVAKNLDNGSDHYPIITYFNPQTVQKKSNQGASSRKQTS